MVAFVSRYICPLPVRCKPGDDVINLLRRHGMARNISAPVGFSQVRAANDHGRAEALVADQIQEVRIDDRAGRSAVAICAVTTRTISFVSSGAPRSITGLGSLRRDVVGDCGGWTTRCRCFVDAVTR